MSETWTYDELFSGLDPAPSFVAELERLGLLRVVARDGGGKSLYGPEAREQLDKVLALVELGYKPKDIAAIARKVGLPQSRRRLFRRPPTYVRLAELSRRSGVDLQVLERWLEASVLRPAMRSEGGEPLFSTPTVDAARALQDLLEFGVTDEQLVEWSHLARKLDALLEHTSARGDDDDATDEQRDRASDVVSEGAQILVELKRRLDRLRVGLRRWDRLVGAYDKRLDRLRKSFDLSTPKPRGGRRKKTRTRRGRGRKLESD